MYTIINISNWDRKEYYEHYTEDIPCTYSLVVNLDITKLLTYSKQNNVKLYPLLIHGLTVSVNSVTEFRYHKLEDNVILFDKLNPEYTILNPDTKSFTSIWTEHDDDIHIFNQNFEKDTLKYSSSKTLTAKSEIPLNTYSISMLPWVNFTSFNLNLEKGYDYLQPIFTFGKYTITDDKVTVPLSIQVHHAVTDGYHVGLFVEKLQSIYNSF